MALKTVCSKVVYKKSNGRIRMAWFWPNKIFKKLQKILSSTLPLKPVFISFVSPKFISDIKIKFGGHSMVIARSTIFLAMNSKNVLKDWSSYQYSNMKKRTRVFKKPIFQYVQRCRWSTCTKNLCHHQFYHQKLSKNAAKWWLDEKYTTFNE